MSLPSFTQVVSVFSVIMTLSAANADQSFPQSTEVRAKILAAGVPEGSLKRIIEFIEKNKGTKLKTDYYTCKGQPDDASPCEESARTYSTKEITILNPRIVVSIDFSMESIKQRMFVIDLVSGDVKRFYVSHGEGSGLKKWAYKFSNIKDSRQSSLGLYQTGEVYDGKYGDSIRLYGLERSNDQAFNRDIVAHRAVYARADYIRKTDPKTGKPFGRLGLSWGCPAISPEDMDKFMPILKAGVIYDIYHPSLMDVAQSGHEVKVEEPQN
jgi:hypothetical protein